MFLRAGSGSCCRPARDAPVISPEDPLRPSGCSGLRPPAVLPVLGSEHARQQSSRRAQKKENTQRAVRFSPWSYAALSSSRLVLVSSSLLVCCIFDPSSPLHPLSLIFAHPSLLLFAFDDLDDRSTSVNPISVSNSRCLLSLNLTLPKHTTYAQRVTANPNTTQPPTPTPYPLFRHEVHCCYSGACHCCLCGHCEYQLQRCWMLCMGVFDVSTTRC